MHCSHCGAQASGNFCSGCGTRLVAGSWENEVRYEHLLAVAEVRDRIAMAAARSVKRMTGEQFLSMCDTALAPFIGGVPLMKIGTLLPQVYGRMGVRTGKTDARTVSTPIGRALVGVLCGLAEGGHALTRVHQAAEGCVLEATIPSDIWSWAGELAVTVTRHGTGSRVEAATKIPGQLYDWGKSRRILDRILASA